MEFKLTIPNVTDENITRWDASSIATLTAADFHKLRLLIEDFGVASAKAQGLAQPITDIWRLRSTDQRLYLHARRRNGCTVVLGGLKVGTKKLFLSRDSGRLREVEPLCVLDFYVHESCQRIGLGKALFEHFLSVEGVTPAALAYDRPSPKLMAFLRKHYGLSAFVPQNNNYVVFNQYWSCAGHELVQRDARCWAAVSERPLTGSAPQPQATITTPSTAIRSTAAVALSSAVAQNAPYGSWGPSSSSSTNGRSQAGSSAPTARSYTAGVDTRQQLHQEPQYHRGTGLHYLQAHAPADAPFMAAATHRAPLWDSIEDFRASQEGDVQPCTPSEQQARQPACQAQLPYACASPSPANVPGGEGAASTSQPPTPQHGHLRSGLEYRPLAPYATSSGPHPRFSRSTLDTWPQSPTNPPSASLSRMSSQSEGYRQVPGDAERQGAAFNLGNSMQTTLRNGYQHCPPATKPYIKQSDAALAIGMRPIPYQAPKQQQPTYMHQSQVTALRHRSGSGAATCMIW